MLLIVAPNSFEVVYGFLPCRPLDLASLPSNTKIYHKEKEFITQLQDIHEQTYQNLLEATAKYKRDVEKKRCLVDFNVDEFV